MNIYVILGCLYGDEGKGSFVNYLCSKAKNPLVIRHNSGHQSGHTVITNDKRHVFSNFGSGTLLNVPTYWSEYCTVSPVGILKEGKVLREMDVNPILYLNANAMITTPFDILQNHKLEEKNNHGSVGVGFGTTIQRNEDHYHLYVRDLFYPAIRNEKLRLIMNIYYRLNFNPENEHQHAYIKKLYDDFIIACDDLVTRYNIVNDLYGFMDNDWIFEGGQGIMLDANYGFFPHVTRSNTTSKNAIEIINKYGIFIDKKNLKTYYVTRAYQTRHGNGYMTNERLDTSYIKENPNETNINECYQGTFRKTVLDLDLLKYAVECDKYHNPISRRSMVITCLDQVNPEAIPVTKKGKLITVNFNEIGSYCGINFKFPCYSDKGFQYTLENC